MGLLPQLRPSAKVASHRLGRSDQPVKHATSVCSSNSNTVVVTTTTTSTTKLSTEAQRLKDTVLAAHADTQPFVRFSLRRMRHRATPPVQIPDKVAHARARCTFVAGHKVPFTRAMHETAKRRVKRQQLGVIDEYVQY